MSTSDDTRVAVVIEDDDDIRRLLETVLAQAGFRVVATSNGADGVDAVRNNDPVVTTLDVNMPGMDGFEVARRIRSFSASYIVMLTALNEEIDTLQGLEAGADDYINKPFRPRELRARIEAMLRRPRRLAEGTPAGAVPEPGAVAVGAPEPGTAVQLHSARHPAPAALAAPVVPGLPQLPAAVGETPVYPPAGYPAPAAPAQMPQRWPGYPQPGYPAAPAQQQPYPQLGQSQPEQPKPETPGAQPRGGLAHTGNGWLEHNGLWLNLETRVVQLNDSELDLTRSEFDLLAALLESGRRVRTKADLVLLLRGESYVTSHFISEADKRAIEVHMGNLRKKIGDNIGNPRWIETVRGVGYRLTASTE
ncbi:MAG: response regulator [Microbacteriaceae bacterium]